jgi:2-polyprenyl-3-methyl-5-hydroxy-6-metoxy-1,4-benzoquinol methylase
MSSEPYHRGVLSTLVERWRLQKAAQYIYANDTVLDLACGEGNLIAYLSPTARYLGIDVSDSSIRAARRRYPSRQFILGDLTQLELDAFKPFDVVVILAFLEHLPVPSTVVASAAAVLTTGGRIIITTPSPHGRKIHALGAQLGLFSRDAAREHYTFLNKEELRRIGQSCRLEMIVYRRFMFGFNQLACLTPSPYGRQNREWSEVCRQ